MRHVGNAVPVLLAKAIADHCAVLLGYETALTGGDTEAIPA